MKVNFLLFGLLNLFSWLQIVQAQSNCLTPFQELPYSSGKYCAKCDTTCASCSGSAINQCASCPTDFTLNTNTSTCAAPINSTVNTVLNSYHIFNFEKENTWFGGAALADSSCGVITVLKGSSGQTIYTTHSLGIHYKIRVRIAFWSFDGAARTLTLNYKKADNTGIQSFTSSSTVAANFNTGQSYFPYCSTAYATNMQIQLDNGERNVKVQFTSSASSWGIREYIFIEYICYLADCASCTGPLQSQCTSCINDKKFLYTSPGTCQCDHMQSYYAYPTGNTTYYCVNPCPNRPQGQYYGDNFTKTCVLTCPSNVSNTLYWNLSFASDQHNFCLNLCPATITLGSVVKSLYYDLVNRKCVTDCPSTQPYWNPADLACYSACPINSGVQFYKLNTLMKCVDICPAITNTSGGAHIPLYRDPTTFSCVQVCPSGYYGYHNTATGDRYCVINSCPNNLFADNSTGRSLCTIICPAPNYFGDKLTLPWSCVQTCSFGTYGDTQDANRLCVAKCNASYYGFQSGNRQCMLKCPSGTWGERISLICLTDPYQCNIAITFPSNNLTGGYTFSTSYRSFADNHTNKCIYATETCSIGMFKLNTSLTCETSCPATTYANNVTYWCVDLCYGLYFADALINKCVLVCSPGYYADRGSSNKCVSRCNQSAAYPYKDDNIRQCVSVCTVGYADPTAQACVYNCTPGLYLNGTDQYNQVYRICATSCNAPYFAYNTSETGICVQTCPNYPATFGDVVSGVRICVSVCQTGYFGDQTNTTNNNYGTFSEDSFRKCVTRCASGTFAQADTSRRCVDRCNSTTFGRVTDWTCVAALDCPLNWNGDFTTNLCVALCPASNGTFADDISKMCVSRCPVASTTIYYADIHTRWCIPTCVNYNASFSYFGNNLTQTCELKCLDNNSFADAQSPRRYCIDLCTHTVLSSILTKYYRNNYTKTCVISTGCSSDYFADNSTYYCVDQCPIVSTVQTWGYIPTQTCVALCLPTYFGDDSSGIPLCVNLCAALPVPKWSYKGPNSVQTVMLCMTVCPSPFFGQDFLRTCVTNCPRANDVVYSTNPFPQTYAYTVTRRCLNKCPDTFYADYVTGVCFPQPIDCTTACSYTATSCSTYRWGDTYNNSCTYLCTSTPWDTYGDNSTQKCTTFCALNSYADSYSGKRICVAQCFGYYTIQGVVKTSFTDMSGTPYDSYGDNFTRRCQKNCIMPDTYADWQSHLCLSRCTGDVSAMVPTYADRSSRRCIIAIFCPETPDKYFGQNITRMCQPTCSLSIPISYAENITRTCLPVCFQYTNATNSKITRFYGDKTTGRPACIIACSANPRQFGQNSTFLCVNECPNFQYGDQTGNRSCVAVCPNILGVTWFSQLTERICVTVCENTTWGNYYNSSGPHCETVSTDCKPTEFAQNSTHMCVPLCPQSLNYFGDESTRKCVSYCPLLTSVVFNSTAQINRPVGRTFADYKTRLCVYTCPLNFGLQGTFGDNTTNVCVQRCPTGSFGDSHTVNRYCVSTCTGGGFADAASTLCVDICPASPPTFGFEGNWTCLATCPANLWASSSTRKCQSVCNPNFRLTLTENECVEVCPSEPDLYGDTNGYNCIAVCTISQFADPNDRLCKTSCLPLFQYNFRCVKVCPNGFYANLAGNCVVATSCDGGYFGDNSTTKCVNPCPSWSYAESTSKLCIAICPDTTYGLNNVCTGSCGAGKSGSNITQLCQSICTNGTYSHNGLCLNTCSGSTYQNQDTRSCASSCPSGLFADSTTNRCVQYCPTGWYRQSTGSNAGFCVQQISGCSPLFSDFVTGNCVTKCSSGYWGYGNSLNSTHTFTGNYSCNLKCPTILGVYGFESTTQRTCYPPNGLPGSVMRFANRLSGQFVTVCPQSPVIYFGDRNRQQCVSLCTAFGTPTATLYYGDPQTRQCQATCQNQTYSRDNTTSLCTLRCTLGTFRYNITPVCTNPCPVGFGDYTSRTCVDVCSIFTNTFGYYNVTSSSRLCVQLCPLTFYAEPLLRTCVSQCPVNGVINYYAYNITRECLLQCKKSFADPDIRVCVSQCNGLTYKNADNSTNKCVPTCPTDPQYYSDSRVCVFFCTTLNYFADKNGRICTSRCSNFTHIQYGDTRTGKCQYTCSEGTWGDNSTNLCVGTCPAGSFADNTTGICVAQCPKTENIYADMLLHVCAYTCSGGRFGSQVNQTCITTCDSDYWGDPTTTLCTARCPVKIYSYGQNVSRTCVSSCIGYTGFADNKSRICREYCQHTISPQTYIDNTYKACVTKCPSGTWATNHTAASPNECLTQCPTGFGDNFTRWCVSVCPDNPQSYGDTFNSKCVYSCSNGYFTDNTTNLCVFQCPSLLSSPAVDYFGDPLNGRCVLWCTEGTFAHIPSRLCRNPCPPGLFADNFTRRCVSDCPASQNTFADGTTHRCVRMCPRGYWAQNTTQACVPDCWTYTTGALAGKVGYEDNITNFCVQICPFFYFGTNTTHACVLECPLSLNEYGHYLGRVCVGTSEAGVVDCYQVSSTTYYGDPTTRTCVQKCPITRWADTHLFKCVTICDANLSPPEYRNNHTQMCVWPCPTDPDQFADSTTGNCVRTCPLGWFAYTGNRTCVRSCGQFSLFADNTTNRCEATCATKPYLYADNITWTCVFHCSGSQFSDNRTQKCVGMCPRQWEYFGQKHNYTCVSLCPAGEFSDKFSQTCEPTCSNSYFSDNFTSTCVEHCRLVRPFWYEDTSLGYGVCVSLCPGQSYAYNTDQTCKYQIPITLVSTCPGPTFFADRTSRKCVNFCPNGTFSYQLTRYCQTTCSGIYYADPVLRKCVTICSSHLYKHIVSVSSQKCVQYCPGNYFAQNSTNSVNAQCVLTCTNLGLPSSRTCQDYCPTPYFGDAIQFLCRLTCEPRFSYKPNRTCLGQCQSPYYGNPNTFKCELLCPDGYFGSSTSRMCTQFCPNLTFADPSTRICVSNCPAYPILYADSRTNQCLNICASPLFGYETSMTCLPSCPNVTNNSRLLVYLADSSNRLCVLQCVNQSTTYADYRNNQCTGFCPDGTFASNYSKECVKICPDQPIDTFAHNTTRMCLAVCLPGSYGMPGNATCVQFCWWPYYADTIARICVDFCPTGYFAVNETAFCRQRCPDNSYADPVTRRCLAMCPALHKYFNYDGNWTCLLQCPPGFYANTDLNKCVSICDSATGLFSYSVTNECVRECPLPYRGYTITRACVLSCPSIKYFYDVTINQCNLCQSNCYRCITGSLCTTCQPGFNLFNGICNISCIPQLNNITYADPSGVCVNVCPNTYFGDNSTYSCRQVCPIKLYGNTTTRLCTNCPGTCSACSTSLICSSCQPGATLAIDNMCYQNCNSTHRYSYNQTCLTTCPDGTFITYTSVTCGPCSPICKTCTGIATFCMTCSATYFFNNTCLTRCPTGYYGSPSLLCLSCSLNATACQNPLDFSTSFTTENFRPVITLQFNQNVSLLRDLSSILNINIRATRRLQEEQAQSNRNLQVGTLVNNGITYTYEILSNGTIKLYPQITSNILNPTFSIQITDPTSVVSTLTGLSLQNVQSLITLAFLQYYPPEQGTEASTNFPAKFVTIIFLFLYVMSFLLSDTMIKPLQILQIIFFHCAINVNIPANFTYFFRQMQHSTFSFVQNIFKGNFPNRSPYYQTPIKISDLFIDEIFLRNIGQIFIWIFMFGGLWFIFLMLSNKRLVAHKIWHSFFEQVSIKRFRWMILHDIFGLFYLPIAYFAFIQMKATIANTQLFYALNSMATIIFIVIALLLPIVLFFIWFKSTSEDVGNKLWFMTLRVKKTESELMKSNDEKLYSQEKSQEKLRNKRQKNEEREENKKEINVNHLQTLQFMVYQLFIAIWMVGLYKYPKPQLIMLIVTNLLHLIYSIVFRPFLSNLNLLFSILSTLVIILIESLILYFEDNGKGMYANEKYNLAFPFLVAADVFCILLLLWGCWRFIWEINFYIKNFKGTLLYLQFADHDYIGEKEQSQKFSEYDKLVQNNVINIGDLVVDQILQKVGPSGEKLISIKKKRLRKKEKIQGRRKNETDLPFGKQDPYMRINNINVFDYQDNFQYSQKESIKIEHRRIDDDVRQDYEGRTPQYEEQEKKIDIEPEEYLIRDIQEINERQKSQKSDFDFIEEQKKSEEEAPYKPYQIQDANILHKQNPNDKKEYIQDQEQPYEHIRAYNQKEQSKIHNESSIIKDETLPKDEKKANQIQKADIEIDYQQLESQKPEQSNLQSQIDLLNMQQIQQNKNNVFNANQLQIMSQSSQESMPNPQKQAQQAKEEESEKPQAQKVEPKIRNIEDLLLQQENPKNKKNLLFLFDDFQQQN